ncbi:MAG: aldehyde:ferredoxin oxidoreductase [Clostridia bacterium]|jgi:aldehyde:ferredoxin oxidoreductase|nr:Aldehyde ferredoxin oxidoreductase [Clostridiales bacterium]MDK2985900.1 aldehyde:ferredoxin oxidoreductase [Clostridia bacterium]
MNNGLHGKVAIIDLDKKAVENFEVPEELYRLYIGGSGLAAKWLMDMTNTNTDPLGPENILIFMTGPMVGTKVPTSSRFAVVSKSPLTGLWGESDCGGSWGLKLKKAGYDGLIIKGTASDPVFINITDNKITFHDATDYWGMDTYETEKAIKEVTGKGSTIACIGPAGENLVRFAGIFTDGKDARTAGRTGLGAVMGSKKLKAIAVSGTGKVNVNNENKLRENIKKLVPLIKENTKVRRAYGTSGGIETMERIGNLPIKNWQLGNWEEAKNISGQRMASTILTGVYHCPTCPIGCGRKVKVAEGPYADVEGAGPEYETVSSLGAYLLVGDLNAVAKANELCNRYGMDTISTGGVIAFAMEAYEKGILTLEDTGGIKLDWGNADSVLQLIKLIAEQKGIGKILGKGVKNAADTIGKGADEFAIHVKGLEPPAHDPRAVFSTAVAYATSNRGACHLQAMSYALELAFALPEIGYPETVDRFEVENKGRMTAIMQNLSSVFDSLKLCKFILYSGISLKDIVEWVNLVTGWNVSITELLESGERLYNLKRLYNVREGITRKDDILPERLISQPRPTGGAENKLPPLVSMLDDYYSYRNWTDEGIPSVEKINQLGLSEYNSIVKKFEINDVI